jgi:phosphohistidine phosphatase
MTLRLILIRHAKSSWDDPFGDDHDRVLNDRGRKAATAIGTWLGANGYTPDVMLCSDAARTVETANRIIPELGGAPELKLSGLIYHAAPDTILDLIKKQSAPAVCVIGHNPGIGMLASGLVKTAPKHHRFNDYPTCATTVVDFDVATWAEVGPRKGVCAAFTVPRDLIGTSNQDID